MHRIDPVGPRENPAVTGVRPVGERRDPPPRDQQRKPPQKQPPPPEQGEQGPPEDGEVRHIDVQA